jgi:DNA-binding MarR family transcriptional regulator
MNTARNASGERFRRKAEEGTAKDGASAAPDILAHRFQIEVPSSDERAVALGLRMKAVEVATSAAWARFIRTQGLDKLMGRYTVLRALYFAPNHKLTQSQIGSDIIVTPGNVSYLVDKLENDGLVARSPHPTNRRVVLVTLTPRGDEVCKAIIPAIANFMTRMFEGLTDKEKTVLGEVLSKLESTAKGSFLAAGVVS